VFGRNSPKQRVGKPVRAKILNGNAAALDLLKRTRVGYGLAQELVGGIITIRVTEYVGPQWQIAKTGGSGVTARSGTTSGSGTVRIWNSDDGTLTDSDEDLDVRNLATTAVANNKYIKICRNRSGDWYVFWEEC